MRQQRESFLTDEIVIPDRVREGINESSVVALMESVGRIGLRTPLTVRWDKDAEGEDVIILVTGRHRLEACRRLSMPMVECVVFEGSEDDARLWEISENLHRADLTEPERRRHIAEWVKLTAEKVFHGGTPLPGGMQPKEQGIRKASKELGFSVAAVKRAVDAESLDDTLKTAADAGGLGTVARAEIAAVSQDKQVAKLQELVERKQARRDLQQAGDEIVQRDAHDDAALIIMDYVPADRIPELLDRLDAGKHHKLAAAIRREMKTGERRSDKPVFDNTRAA